MKRVATSHQILHPNGGRSPVAEAILEVADPATITSAVFDPPVLPAGGTGRLVLTLSNPDDVPIIDVRNSGDGLTFEPTPDPLVFVVRAG